MNKMELKTSYFANVQRANKEGFKCFSIALTQPKNALKLPEIKYLAPTRELLALGKQEGLSDYYKDIYLQRLKQFENKILTILKRALKTHQKVCLICWEKDALTCHRSILSAWLKERGFAISEFIPDASYDCLKEYHA